MGQYYYPINIDKKEFIDTWDYNNGAKLMEHSYIGNNMMNVIEQLLSPEGLWHKCRLIWAGDYADEENDEQIKKLIEDVYLLKENENHKRDHGENFNLHHIANINFSKITPQKEKRWQFIVNHSKKLFVDKIKVEEDPNTSESTGKWAIHPLSILTAEGNNRGGGDYHKEDERIGSWARDIISMENKIPKGYKEIDGIFYE